MLPHTGAPPSLPSDPVLSLLPSPWYHLPYLPAVWAPVAAGYTSRVCKEPSFTKGCVSATTLNQPAKFLQGIRKYQLLSTCQCQEHAAAEVVLCTGTCKELNWYDDHLLISITRRKV